METYVKASDGKDIRLSNKPEPYGGADYASPIPMMDRDVTRADTTITVNGFELSYDSRGYCYSRLKLRK